MKLLVSDDSENTHTSVKKKILALYIAAVLYISLVSSTE